MEPQYVSEEIAYNLWIPHGQALTLGPKNLTICTHIHRHVNKLPLKTEHLFKWCFYLFTIHCIQDPQHKALVKNKLIKLTLFFKGLLIFQTQQGAQRHFYLIPSDSGSRLFSSRVDKPLPTAFPIVIIMDGFK